MIKKGSNRDSFMKCPECGKKCSDVCKNCGLVINAKPIVSDERGIKRNEDGRLSREFQNPISPNISLQSTHDKKTKNKELKRAFKIEKKTNKRRDILRKQNAIIQIKRIANNLKLPKTIIYRAVYLFEKLMETNFFKKNQKTEASYPALIMIAAKEKNHPLLFKEIFEYTVASRKMIVEAYKEIIFMFNIKINQPPILSQLHHDIEKFNLDVEERKECYRIANKIKGKRRHANLVRGYTAAIIYMASDNLTQDVIEKKMKISISTIYKRLTEIKRWLK